MQFRVLGLSELTGFQPKCEQLLRARNSDLKSQVGGTFRVSQLSERRRRQDCLLPSGKKHTQVYFNLN